MLIQPTGGLCNYLRVVFSYYKLAQIKKTKLIVLWIITPECNGYFLDYFKPIENIEFIQFIQYQKKYKIHEIYYIGYNSCPNYTPEYNKLELLQPLKNEIIKKSNILDNDYIAVHIRRTDHIYSAKKNNCFTSDENFINFIDNIKHNNLYVATDNKDTYDKFKIKYNVKLDYHNTRNCIRQTSLKDAIIDLYMCIYAKEFKGSGWSSFSELIYKIRNII